MLPSKFVPCYGDECQSEYKSHKNLLGMRNFMKNMDC